MKHSTSAFVCRVLAAGAMTIAILPAAPASAQTSAAVAWTGAVNAAGSGGTLRKTTGCPDCYDAGAVSQQQIASGSISFRIATGQKLFAGLGRDKSTSTSYAIDYAFKFTGSSWEVREGNVYRTEGSYSSNDLFSIAVSGASVTYYRNGTLVYTSKVAASGTFVMDTSIQTIGGTVSSAAIAGSSSGTVLPPPPPPPASSSMKLRVLQWNTHHGGYGTDGVYNPDRLASWAASFNPDVVMFNEIEKNNSWGNQNQPEVYKALLQQKTGRTWYYMFAQEFGDWNSNGKGNLILSRYPISVTDRYELMQNYDRSIGMATITVNSRDITLISTHLDPYDKTLRLAQAKEVTAWSAVQPENRIIAGDMNAWPDQTSIAHFNTLYNDSWAVALAAGQASAFAGNNGETKNGRIDYIFYSKNASNLRVLSSQVYDTRDSNGVTPSDHRPVLTVFEVR